MEEYHRMFSKSIKSMQVALSDVPSRIIPYMKSTYYLKGVERDLEVVVRNVKPGEAILDFGNGIGYITALLGSFNFEICGVEIASEVPSIHAMSDAAEVYDLNMDCWRRFSSSFNAAFCLFDGKRLPFKERSFNCVLAYATLEHISDKYVEAAICEIWRVLKEGGLFIAFRTPRKDSLTERIVRSHPKLMSEEEVVSLLERNGFKIRSVDRTDIFPAFLPGHLQQLLNFFSPILVQISNIAEKTPVGGIAHNMRIIGVKEER